MEFTGSGRKRSAGRWSSGHKNSAASQDRAYEDCDPPGWVSGDGKDRETKGHTADRHDFMTRRHGPVLSPSEDRGAKYAMIEYPRFCTR